MNEQTQDELKSSESAEALEESKIVAPNTEDEDAADDAALAAKEEAGEELTPEEVERREKRRARRAAVRESKREKVRAYERLKAAQHAEPKEADFGDAEEYKIAKVIWRSRQAEHQAELKRVETEVSSADEEEQSLELEEFSEQIASARKRYDDFDKVVFDKKLPVSPALAKLIVEAEQSAELAYHLGKNPDLARKLSEMSAVRMARELGKVEAGLGRTASSTPPKRVTNAPPPARTVSGAKGADMDAKSIEAMSQAEYEKLRSEGRIQ